MDEFYGKPDKRYKFPVVLILIAISLYFLLRDTQYIIIMKNETKWRVIYNPKDVGITAEITGYAVDEKGYEKYEFTEFYRVKTLNGEAVKYR